MQTVENPINAANNAGDKRHREQNPLPKIDQATKLYFIEKVLKESPYIGAKHISDLILQTEGIYIDAKECRALLKKYRFVSYHSYLVALVITVLLVIGVAWTVDFTPGMTLLAVLLSPLAFNLMNEMNLIWCFYRFNHQALLPEAVDANTPLPSVAVLIPSCNEPFLVAKMTFDSAMALSYGDNEKEIVVVDNSDSDFAEYQQWHDYVESFSPGGENAIPGTKVCFIHRDGREGFKPRNLDLALAAVSAEYIMYLDIDSTLQADTLLRLMPSFAYDLKLGFIQLHTVPTNSLSSSSLALIQGIRSYTQRLFLGLSTHGGHALFYGHNAVWRTSAVKSLGDCLEHHNGEVVVSEDFSMSLRAVQNGYHGKTAWIPSGEWVPMSIRETEAMWLRWTVGSFQVFAKYFATTVKDTQFKQVVLYSWFQHMVTFLNYGLVPFYLVCGLLFQSPIFMMLAGLSILPRLMLVVVSALKLSLGGMKLSEKLKKCYLSFFVLDSFINWVCFIGLIRFFSGQKQGWTPTGKASEALVPMIVVAKQRWLILLFSVLTIGYSGYLMMAAESILDHVLLGFCGFWGINTLLSVLLFGQSRMEAPIEREVGHGRVEDFERFY
ncbi:MAG: cellulose synthase/poly-beta-1,6-N-acetylglucosamine synthase-like glycosyltransferase [Phenylobacterium sp.]|jgi:cellulose synthase/poly-beta-1,6-N-acetylglucosamine synthase-like glycosyltransferase